MGYELRTTALVAGTLGAATVAAALAVFSATVTRADDVAPIKISDRLPVEASTSAPTVWAVDGPFEIRSRTGEILYSYDPVMAETTVAKGFMPPVPQPRPEALVRSEVPLPLPKPALEATAEPASYDTAELDPASVPLPLPKPAIPMETAWLQPGDTAAR